MINMNVRMNARVFFNTLYHVIFVFFTFSVHHYHYHHHHYNFYWWQLVYFCESNEWTEGEWLGTISEGPACPVLHLLKIKISLFERVLVLYSLHIYSDSLFYLLRFKMGHLFFLLINIVVYIYIDYNTLLIVRDIIIRLPSISIKRLCLNSTTLNIFW